MRDLTQDQASRIKDQGSRIKDQASRIKDQGSRIKDQGSRIKDLDALPELSFVFIIVRNLILLACLAVPNCRES
jgi:hypothetical protein